jgi:transcription elongation factor GreA
MPGFVSQTVNVGGVVAGCREILGFLASTWDWSPAGQIGKLTTSGCDFFPAITGNRVASFFDLRRESAMAEYVSMTREGYNRIKAEIERLETVEMPLISEKIADARAEGDLKENAEYHAQRENQGLMQSKINSLKAKLAMAHIVDTSLQPKDQVAFGATVKLKDSWGDEEVYQLVGAGDEDYENGKILSSSPFGTALMGKKVGETIEIQAPRGTLKYTVLSIEYNE